MNKTTCRTVALLLAVAGVAGLTGIPSAAQVDAARVEADAMRAIQADVLAPRPVAVTMAVQDYTGALNQQNISARINSTLEEVVRQKLDYGWGTFRPVPVVILYEDPTGKDQVRMAIGVTVPAKVKVKAPLRLEKTNFPKAVRHIHQGPHEQLGRAYRAIDQNLKTRAPGGGASWPVVMQILDDPTRISQDKLRTLLNVPIK